MSDDAAIDTLAERVRGARKIGVLTGAGVSAASGVPTFRGDGGLWRTHDAKELATKAAFKRDPKLVWEFFLHRRELMAAAAPNRAHEVLAAWSKRHPNFTLITQNIDGLHERAETVNVIRLHGSIWEVGCWLQCADAPRRWRDKTRSYPRLPPKCPHCGGPLRPGTVWFGEQLPLSNSFRAAQATQCDLFLVIGTSAVVHPAAGLIGQAKAAGAFVVELNLEPTPATEVVDLSITAPAEVVLAQVESLLEAEA